MKLPIEKALVINTCHITRVDNDYLKDTTEQSFDLCRVVNFEYGFIIFLTAEMTPDIVAPACNGAGFSNGFISLIDLAVKYGCSYLVLDRDGVEVPELRTYQW